MSNPPRIPIKASVGEALRFVRANWRFALITGALGAVGIVAMTPLPLIGIVGLYFIMVAANAALVSAAMNGAVSVRPRLANDTLRVAAALAIVGFVLAILLIVAIYIAMAVLIAPYADQVRAAGEDQTQLAAIMNTAVAAQPQVISWALVLGGLVIFYFTTRFYFAAPATIDRSRISAFGSWRLTSGNVLRIMGARILLLLPAIILVGAVQALVGAAFGFSTSDPVALMAQAQANPAFFFVFFGVGMFVQIALYSALESGLAAALYRAAKGP